MADTKLVIATLTEEEKNFVHYLEVMGLPVTRAGELAGITSPGYVAKKPAVIEAREALREIVHARVDITKEDVLEGFKDAIGQAKLLADPMSQIAGWREIGKMMGFDAPREVNIKISADVRTMRRQIQQLADEDLVEMLKADNVVDADFYDVQAQHGH